MIGIIISVASLIVSAAATYMAKSSLAQTRLSLKEQQRANEQAQTDWAQRKWFDLYFKVGQACTALERYQADYERANAATPSVQQMKDHNELMLMFREVIAIGSVFPKNQVLDELFAAMNFSSPSAALSRDRLKALADAVELLRQKALIHKRVLDVLTD